MCRLIAGHLFGHLLPMVALLCGAASTYAQDTTEVALDERLAVRLALEQNLGLQADKLNAQLADLDVLAARTAWTPIATSRLVQSHATTPSSSSLLTGANSLERRASVETQVIQRVWWGTEYQITWDGANRATNNVLSRFNPELTSGLAVSVTQSLTRAFGIDQDRANFRLAQIGRGRADVAVEQAVVSMTRAARRAYWEWVYAFDVADVQRQSLQLARVLLQGNRRRAEAGALAPTDVIEAEAEVARREESVLVSTSAAADAEQALKRVIVNPRRPSELWFTRGPIAEPTLPDLELGLERAPEARLELQLLQRDLESEDVNIRLATVDARPDVRVQADYQAQSLAGTELLRTGTFPGTVSGTAQHTFASALRDVWTNAYPTWSAQVQVSYPLGTARAEAAKAAARLRRRQIELTLADAELAARTEIETIFRGATTNRQRVAATHTSLALAERRLDAEERKFNAGLSTSFFVFQAQRDLSNARESALRAALDFRRSVADADAVQVISLNAIGSGPRR